MCVTIYEVQQWVWTTPFLISKLYSLSYCFLFFYPWGVTRPKNLQWNCRTSPPSQPQLSTHFNALTLITECIQTHFSAFIFSCQFFQERLTFTFLIECVLAAHSSVSPTLRLVNSCLEAAYLFERKQYNGVFPFCCCFKSLCLSKERVTKQE